LKGSGRMLKVLFPAHIKWYNAEAEYLHRLARGMRRRGHAPVIWGRPGSPLLSRAAADGVETVEWGDPASTDPAKLITTARFMERLIREGGFDLVNAHRSEGFPVLAWTARKAGAPMIRTRADMRTPRLAFLNGAMHRRLTAAVITANDILRDEIMLRFDLAPDRVTTIRMGIRPGEMTPARGKDEAKKELGIGPQEKVVGVMGRLGPVKGQEFLLRAAPRIIEALPETRFLVIYPDVEGSDKFLPALQRSPIKDRFVFAGPRPDRADLMQLADVAVIPSVGSEAHCRVALEWMDLSVPLVGSRVGVIPEIIDHGATGFLVQPRYSETIADCLIELLSNTDRARRMGEAGRQRLEREFTEDAMVEANLEVFEKAVGAGL